MGIHSVVSPTTITKTPGATLPLSADWSKHPLIAQGSTLAAITSVAKSILNGDAADTLTISGAQIDGEETKAAFAGGTDGQTYRIIWTVVFSDGSIDQHVDTLVIESGYA